MNKKSSDKKTQREYIPEPPPSAAIVITGTLIDEAAELFCPRVEPDAPKWAHRAAKMVLFSILPIWRPNEAPKTLPPPLPALDSREIERMMVKYGAKPLPSSKKSIKNRGNEEPGFFDPIFTPIQLAPPLWAIRLRGAKSEEYKDGFGCGVLSGALGLLPPESSQGAIDIVNYRKQEAAQLPSDQAADFFTGLRDGERRVQTMPERAREMAQRTKCFQAIAKGWRKILSSGINDAQGLHDWLIKMGLLVNHRDSKAEARKICRLIGFDGLGKAGKPPEQK